MENQGDGVFHTVPSPRLRYTAVRARSMEMNCKDDGFRSQKGNLMAEHVFTCIDGGLYTWQFSPHHALLISGSVLRLHLV